MPLFQCSNCGAVENTALSRYWNRRGDEDPFCSPCDPNVNGWHGIEKRDAFKDGYWLGNDGFLYTQEDINSGYLDWRIKNQNFKMA